MPVEDTFAGISGQDEAVALLRRALGSGRVAHAYAFVGPSGSGRTRTALSLATALVAPNGGPAAARVERGVHPDVRVIRPTPPEKNPKGPFALRIDDVRALERFAALRPVEAPWKVFIVDEAERMTVATPQAFLKTLEEPPDRTVIILILSQLRALPATVLSRCQIVRFRPRHAEGTVALLPDGRDEARRRAVGVLADVERGGVEAILRAGDQVGRDRQTAEILVETCWLRFRDLLCAQVGGAARLAVFAADETPPPGRRSFQELLARVAACRDAWYALQGNVSPRLTVEVLLSRLQPEVA
ncbi:MAG TPA: DNA polymerase III subunit [Candidatus Methylomirabilis sp.]|nr:DNA polymerase III subunit [Candidatus Methylomirabilis sp.]